MNDCSPPRVKTFATTSYPLVSLLLIITIPITVKFRPFANRPSHQGNPTCSFLIS